MNKKFNLETYKESINRQIEETEQSLLNLKANKPSENSDLYERFNWRKSIQDAEEHIGELRLRLNPQYFCEYCYSDRHAYKVIRIESETRMVVRRLEAKRTDGNGMSESQDYQFTESSRYPDITLRLHKNGLWYTSDGVNPFGLTDEPYEYYDFSF